MTTPHRILIIGARGFLGSHLLLQARTEGYEAIAGYRSAAGPGCIDIDVCNPISVDSALRTTAPSIVINCAAYGVNYAEQDLERALEVNVMGAVGVLEAAARCQVTRLVHIGSCFEYGSHEGAIAEDFALNPTAVYGATKAAASILLRERAHALKVPLIIARPFGIWGPGEPEYRIVPQVIAACCARSALKLTHCEVVRDYLYVEDLAKDIISLAMLPNVEPGTVVNLGTGEPLVLREFVHSIAQSLGGESYLQFGALPYRPTEMPSLVADVRRMHQLLGRTPRTALHEGIRRMLASVASTPQ